MLRSLYISSFYALRKRNGFNDIIPYLLLASNALLSFPRLSEDDRLSPFLSLQALSENVNKIRYMTTNGARFVEERKERHK